MDVLLSISNVFFGIDWMRGERKRVDVQIR